MLRFMDHWCLKLMEQTLTYQSLMIHVCKSLCVYSSSVICQLVTILNSQLIGVHVHSTYAPSLHNNYRTLYKHIHCFMYRLTVIHVTVFYFNFTVSNILYHSEIKTQN